MFQLNEYWNDVTVFAEGVFIGNVVLFKRQCDVDEWGEQLGKCHILRTFILLKLI